MTALQRAALRITHCRGPQPLKVIVVGSPRAGTSFVAGLVQRMGFSLGPRAWLKKADAHNPYGYFECLPLLRISDRILTKLGGDFFECLPRLTPGWTEPLEAEKREIASLVRDGGIEMYKGNRLLVLADLYGELFPEAKWIVVQRSIEATYRSRFGTYMPFEEWVTITQQRLERWHASRPSAKALTVQYEDFADLDQSVRRVQAFLDVDLSLSQWRACLDFYRPQPGAEAGR